MVVRRIIYNAPYAGSKSRINTINPNMCGNGKFWNFVKKTTGKIAKPIKNAFNNTAGKAAIKLYKNVIVPTVKTAANTAGFGKEFDAIEKAGKSLIAGRPEDIAGDLVKDIVKSRLGDTKISQVAGEQLSNLVKGAGLINGRARPRLSVQPPKVINMQRAEQIARANRQNQQPVQGEGDAITSGN